MAQAFGNFVVVVGAGWLLADAVGLPLLQHCDAHAVGLKARRIASNLVAEVAAARNKQVTFAGRRETSKHYGLIRRTEADYEIRLSGRSMQRSRPAEDTCAPERGRMRHVAMAHGPERRGTA